VAAAIGGRLVEVLDAVLYLDKKQIVQIGGVRLHPSESHLLACAVEGMTFTQMARRFGISKGAVSQTFARLADKGVLAVAKDASRKNAARVALTPLGDLLHAHVVAVRQRMGVDLGRRLSGYTGSELSAVARFVGDLHTFVEESLARLSIHEGGAQ
jgi:DNA-binding MarR family transcriptional regulator